MSPTVLTCGALRLRVPPGAALPAVAMRAPGVVDVSFAAFSGTVTFEALPPAHRAGPATFEALPPAHPAGPASPPPPPSPAALDTHVSPAPASPPPASQPLALPALPRFDPADYAPPDAYHPTQHFPASQLPDALSGSQLPDASPGALSGSQLPDATPDTLSASQLHPPPAPSIPHFAADYIPLTPPSSDDSDHEPPDHEPPLPDRPQPAKPLAKRPAASAKVDYRPSKHGKRVRFEDRPTYFHSPHPDPPESPASPTPPAHTRPPAAPAAPTAPAAPAAPTPTTAPVSTKPTPWTPVALPDHATPPPRRWGATFTRLNSASVILLGGESERDGIFNQMAIFDVHNRVWLQHGKDTPDMLASGRAWHTTTCVDHNLFVFGGEMLLDGERSQTNHALIYDTTYYTWYPPALSGTPPPARAGHCAAVVPGTKNLVIYGGINGNRWLNDLHLLEDLNSWTKVRLSTKSERPAARSYASLTPASGHLVLFGGNNKTRCFNDVHLLTPHMTWVQPVVLGRSPKPRTGHSAISSRDGKRVIVYGGWDDQGAHRLFYSDVWELNISSPSECQWHCLYAGDNTSKTPGPRAGAALCGTCDEHDDMLLFGGWYQVSYYNDLTKLVLPRSPQSVA